MTGGPLSGSSDGPSGDGAAKAGTAWPGVWTATGSDDPSSATATDGGTAPAAGSDGAFEEALDGGLDS
jgi:hypothetical protein